MNELRPRQPDPPVADHRKVVGWEQIRRSCADYLHDESRLAAERLEAVHFPATAEEVADAVMQTRRAGHRAVVSGGRTGITGAAVPLGAERVISLDAIKPKPVVRHSGDGWSVRVGGGTTLAELTDALAHGLCDYPDGKPPMPLLYPIDPTETSAQLGGTIATNASGGRTLHYGPTRAWVEWLRLVTPDGRILELRRDQVAADGGCFVYVRSDGTGDEIPIPDLPAPDTKHTAGYRLKPGMDAVDLFVGSEGTLGIIVEAELRLTERPPNRLFLTQFLDGPAAAVELTLACKGHPLLSPLALEYIGPRALALLRDRGRETPAYVEVSRLPADAGAALYLEIPFADEDELDALYDALREVLASVGLNPDRGWAGFGDRDLEEMKRLRHAVPETVNSIIGQRQAQVPELRKVGTDMAVPDGSLQEMMGIYHRRLQECGLDFVVFGHIGNGHVHVNILPRTAAEMARAEELYVEVATEAVQLGGSVAGEHGIGRIKRKFLPIQYGPEQIAAMRAVKDALDPDGILNPGVLFPD